MHSVVEQNVDSKFDFAESVYLLFKIISRINRKNVDKKFANNLYF